MAIAVVFLKVDPDDVAVDGELPNNLHDCDIFWKICDEDCFGFSDCIDNIV